MDKFIIFRGVFGEYGSGRGLSFSFDPVKNNPVTTNNIGVTAGARESEGRSQESINTDVEESGIRGERAFGIRKRYRVVGKPPTNGTKRTDKGVEHGATTDSRYECRGDSGEDTGLFRFRVGFTEPEGQYQRIDVSRDTDTGVGSRSGASRGTTEAKTNSRGNTFSGHKRWARVLHNKEPLRQGSGKGQSRASRRNDSTGQQVTGSDVGVPDRQVSHATVVVGRDRYDSRDNGRQDITTEHEGGYGGASSIGGFNRARSDSDEIESSQQGGSRKQDSRETRRDNDPNERADIGGYRESPERSFIQGPGSQRSSTRDRTEPSGDGDRRLGARAHFQADGQQQASQEHLGARAHFQADGQQRASQEQDGDGWINSTPPPMNLDFDVNRPLLAVGECPYCGKWQEIDCQCNYFLFTQ